MAINGVFTEPGVYSQFEPTPTFPVLPGGVRVVALIGNGRQTNLIEAETVTKGALNSQDDLAHTAVSLNSAIVDQDYNTYELGVDYQLTAGKVDWSLSTPAELTGTESETFDMSSLPTLKLTVGDANGGLEQSYTFQVGDFVVPAAATAAEVATAITSNFSGATASDDSGKVKIATNNGDNTSLLIGDGNANTTLGFVGGSFVETPREPAPGKTYQVGYEYAKVSADYIPRFFFNMDSVIAEHGDVLTSNTLSLGAEIVFQHGASVVCLVQIDPADGAVVQQFRKAIDKLEQVVVNIVAPLTTDSSLYSYVKQHVNLMSSTLERKERIGIVGVGTSLTVSQIIAQATALDDRRMTLVYPGSATRYVGTNTTVSTLDGSFLAAAIGGIRTSRSFDVAEPLTRKELVGFEDIPDTLLRAEKNQLASNGVLVVENVGGIFRVRHGLTTDPSTVDNREISVVEIVDYTAVNSRGLLEAIFIGQKILEDTPSQVRSVVAQILQNLVDNEIIVAYQSIQASINSLDPTQIDVSFEISPVRPLNYILIKFSISPNI